MRGVFVIIMMGLGLLGQAQTLYVVPGGNGDGSSWTNAMGRIGDALAKAGDEVRVAVGTYLLDAELFIPAGKTLSGGWIADAGVKAENPSAQTILQVTGQFRVATVAGIIEGVTVQGGVVHAANGGGLYVRATGVVRNCIVRNNVAAEYSPKVGDAWCGDGKFLRKEEINTANGKQVEGIVFWINPDPAAPSGQRGWVVNVDPPDYYGGWTYSEYSGNVTEKRYKTLLEALADTAGYEHTQRAKEKGTEDDYPAVFSCTDGWYLPALGQLRTLIAEWERVEATYQVVRNAGGGGYFPFLLDKASPYWSSSEAEEGKIWLNVVEPAGLGGVQAVDWFEEGGILSVKSF